MFWHKRDVKLNEQYRLMTSIEHARKKWTEIQAWRIEDKEDMYSQMPKVLAEIRYRYLLQQARKREFMNYWYLDLDRDS
ncbi:hypothetical protein [Caldalkalibacillus salinus]|uniref:hypothetical protein n=1 Tax=Caldalkalibacillus salinus TaxID=2803787 RepID=UPI001924814A|nr:hypothetical protein [Caldalkalibacillus salinus]